METTNNTYFTHPEKFEDFLKSTSRFFFGLMLGPGGFDVYIPKNSDLTIKGYGKVQCSTDSLCAIACTQENKSPPPK